MYIGKSNLYSFAYHLVDEDVCKGEKLGHNKCNPARDCRKRNNEAETRRYHDCDTGDVILINVYAG